jgi:hypothetical protein
VSRARERRASAIARAEQGARLALAAIVDAIAIGALLIVAPPKRRALASRRRRDA